MSPARTFSHTGFFHLRALWSILLPLAFAAYYTWTYAYWLRPSSNPAADVDKPLPNGLYVWWSWFVIGAVGINVSKYVLAGAEAGMMMRPRFKPKTVAHIRAHREKGWSTLGAWLILLGVKGRRNRLIGGLWITPFVLSVLSWTFVLSGLSMETYEGRKVGDVPGASVVGVSQETMNNRPVAPYMDVLFDLWSRNAEPKIPLAAALYAPAGSISFNTSTPNTLPADASTEIFLAPQASVPLTGHIWGLLFKYNCSQVRKLSQFTILNRRINSKSRDYVSHKDFSVRDMEYFYTLGDDSSIVALSQIEPGASNIIGFAEVGTSTGFASLLENSDSWGYSCSGWASSAPTYSGLDEEDIFELALWQTFWNPPGTTGDFIQVQDPIPELANEHSQPDSPWRGDFPWDGDMAAIGIRCTSSSTTGTAKINGFTGTFENFERQDPLSGQAILPNVPRLGPAVPLMILKTNQNSSFFDYGYLDPGVFSRLANYSVNYTVVKTHYDWIKPLAVAGGMQLNLSSTAQQFDYYHTLLQRRNLEQAVVSAYKQSAAQLMFQGASTVGEAWVSENVTAGITWPFIRAGPGIPPIFVLVSILLWAVGCISLVIFYGFQRRWSATFDDEFLGAMIRDHDGIKVEDIFGSAQGEGSESTELLRQPKGQRTKVMH